MYIYLPWQSTKAFFAACSEMQDNHHTVLVNYLVTATCKGDGHMQCNAFGVLDQWYCLTVFLFAGVPPVS